MTMNKETTVLLLSLLVVIRQSRAQDWQEAKESVDENTRLWRGVETVFRELRDEERVLWPEKMLNAVSSALRADKRRTFLKPKVYIYSYPREFALKTKALFGTESYYEAAYHFKKKNATPIEAWHWDASGSLHWIPSASLAYGNEYSFVARQDYGTESAAAAAGNCEHSDCAFYLDQHLLGPLVHRGLFSEDIFVTDPEEADLFFIPHHTLFKAKTYDDKVTSKKFCSIAMQSWLGHMENIRNHQNVSYLRRYKGKDHFVATGRVWHAFKSVYSRSQARGHAKLRDKQDQPLWRVDCDEWATEPKLRNVHKLLPEAQLHPLRKHMHPVPYPGFLFHGASSGTFGEKWFFRDDKNETTDEVHIQTKKYMLSGFLSTKTEKPDGIRIEARGPLLKQCRQWENAFCPDTDKIIAPPSFFKAGARNKTTTVPLAFLAYRDSHLSLQPPGITAARKGIVDSLLAGCIPVLVDGLHGTNASSYTAQKPLIDSLDQADLWPWHWPWQTATSLVIHPPLIQNTGIKSLFSQLSSTQLSLMRAVIKRKAADLAWPYRTQLFDLRTTPRRLRHRHRHHHHHHSASTNAHVGAATNTARALDITLHHLAILSQAGN